MHLSLLCDLQQVTFCASISPSVNWAARAPHWVILETEGACVGRGLPPEHEHPLPPQDKPPPAARALGWRTCSPARGARPVAAETEAWEQHQPPDARSRWLGASCAPCGPRGAEQGSESPRGALLPGSECSKESRGYPEPTPRLWMATPLQPKNERVPGDQDRVSTVGAKKPPALGTKAGSLGAHHLPAAFHHHTRHPALQVPGIPDEPAAALSRTSWKRGV